MNRFGIARIDLGIGLALIASTVAVYGQVLGFEFVNADDQTYITGNLQVQRGLTPSSILWALSTGEGSNWHPLTWLSHMLDIELFGMWAGGHHLTNLLFHTLNTLLLFSVLQTMTKARGPSAFVAALFALHPLHVESVAWVSERKDVLSTFFGLLSMRAYATAVQKRRPRLGSAAFFLAVGLLAKPMLVTLPLVFLLLDYWPLGRLRIPAFPVVAGARAPRRIALLLSEKFPLFALSVASCALTYVAQQSGGAIKSDDVVSLPLRAGNAAVSYLRYLGKMFWPADLGILYPHPNVAGTGGEPWAVWQIGGALLLLAVASLFFLHIAKRPYAIVGWLWYLGTLVPVIGLVQVGNQAIADRYTYIPLIGIFLIVAWGGAELVDLHRKRRTWMAHAIRVVAVGVLLSCAIVTSQQTRLWRNSILLFEHALEVAPRNSIIHVALGASHFERRSLDDAIYHSRKALEIKPDYVEASWNLGNALRSQGHDKQAIAEFERALEIEPDNALTHYNLGNAFFAMGRWEDALAPFERAIALNPRDPKAHHNLGNSYRRLERPQQAEGAYQRALELDPNFALSHYMLARVQSAEGRFKQSVPHYRRALELQPDHTGARYHLERALQKLGEAP